MDMVAAVLKVGYVLVFFIAVFLSLKFEFGSESKDERGKTISNMSYRYAFPLLPLGWLALELYGRYINAISYETYKTAIWFLLTFIIIIQAGIVTGARKKY
ncbi:hypothetical protein HNO89_003951 [Sporosarcina luteola]|nr:hypothetical protein [Sporosarcina luteola]